METITGSDTMKMSDIFDIPIVLRDKNGHFHTLQFDGYVLEQPEDFPVVAILTKGEHLSKEEVGRYNG